MATSITLNKMLFYAHHGVAPQERTVGNRFEVTLTVHCDMQHAIETDELSGTINYAAIYNIVNADMSVPSTLREHVAGRIIRAITRRYGSQVSGGTITVAKLCPPFKCQLESVAVTIDF